jgi:hypothetical protein
MRTNRILTVVSMTAFCLLLTSCFDSKTPLSDPHKSKSDDRLIGVWRFRGDSGEVNYYHIGCIGEKVPASVMRVVSIQHMPDGKIQQSELLVFPTTIGSKTYLNVSDGKQAQLKRVEEKGWTAETVDTYLILRYQVTGDALAVEWMDNEAKKRSIDAGTIKGVIEKDQDGNTRARFTDTTENLAKFVAEAGDGLFSTDVLRLERVK